MTESHETTTALEEKLSPWTRALLDVLTDREREAIVLRETGMTFAEAADALGVTAERGWQLVDQAADKMTAAAARAVLLHRHVPAVEPHPRPADCAAKKCTVPIAMLGALDLPVSILDLDVKGEKCLESAGIEYVGQLVGLYEFDLLRIKYLGRKTLKVITGCLSAIGLHLGMDVGNWQPPKRRRAGPAHLRSCLSRPRIDT